MKRHAELATIFSLMITRVSELLVIIAIISIISHCPFEDYRSSFILNNNDVPNNPAHPLVSSSKRSASRGLTVYLVC